MGKQTTKPNMTASRNHGTKQHTENVHLHRNTRPLHYRRSNPNIVPKLLTVLIQVFKNGMWNVKCMLSKARFSNVDKFNILNLRALYVASVNYLTCYLKLNFHDAYSLVVTDPCSKVLLEAVTFFHGANRGFISAADARFICSRKSYYVSQTKAPEQFPWRCMIGYCKWTKGGKRPYER